MTDLTEYGVDQEQVNRIENLFTEGVREAFDENGVEYDSEHVEEILDVFRGYWADVMKVSNHPPIDRLEEELADDKDHANVGFIIGMAAVRFDSTHPARKLTNVKIAENYDRTE